MARFFVVAVGCCDAHDGHDGHDDAVVDKSNLRYTLRVFGGQEQGTGWGTIFFNLFVAAALMAVRSRGETNKPPSQTC